MFSSPLCHVLPCSSLSLGTKETSLTQQSSMLATTFKMKNKLTHCLKKKKVCAKGQLSKHIFYKKL